MDKTPVTSSNLVSVGHEGTTLEVEFKHGAVYRYFLVPREKFDALLAAESCGKYLNAEIKPHHGYTLIDPNDPAEKLSTLQQQLDIDGIVVGVSRQALDETLAELRYLRWFHKNAPAAPQPADYERLYGPLPKGYANADPDA